MPQTLVTEERYRALTDDLTTSQAVVLRNLERAVRAACGALNRPEGGLESMERTEVGWQYTLDIHRSGDGVAPICTPVTAGPVITPMVDDRFEEAWRHIYVLPALPRRRRVTMVYTGGWTAYDGATPLPAEIEDAIVAAAYALRPDAIQAAGGLQLAGATQRTIGDVSLTYAKPLAGAGQLPTGMFDSIKRYRYRGLGAV